MQFKRNLSYALLTATLATTVVACGSDSGGVGNEKPTQSQDTTENTKPDNSDVTNNTAKNNFFGKEIAKGYAGNFTLSCETFDVITRETSNVTKVMSISDNGKVVFDGKTVYENNKIGSFTLTTDEKSKNDSINFGNKEILLGIVNNDKTGNQFISVSISIGKEKPLSYSCVAPTFRNSKHFTQNIGDYLKGRINNSFEVGCIDYKDEEDLISFEVVNESKETLMILNDNTVKVGSMMYSGSNFGVNDLTIVTGNSKEGVKSYQFISTNEKNVDYDKANRLTIYLDGNEEFQSLILRTDDTKVRRTCGIKR